MLLINKAMMDIIITTINKPDQTPALKIPPATAHPLIKVIKQTNGNVIFNLMALF
jgi:hypothetical protein